eukprot:Em0012g393a
MPFCTGCAVTEGLAPFPSTPFFTIKQSALQLNWDFRNISKLFNLEFTTDCYNPSITVDGNNKLNLRNLASRNEDSTTKYHKVFSTKVVFSFGRYCASNNYNISSNSQTVMMFSNATACFSCFLPGLNKSDIWQVNGKEISANVNQAGSLIVANPGEIFGSDMTTSILSCGNRAQNASIAAIILYKVNTALSIESKAPEVEMASSSKHCNGDLTDCSSNVSSAADLNVQPNITPASSRVSECVLCYIRISEDRRCNYNEELSREELVTTSLATNLESPVENTTLPLCLPENSSILVVDELSNPFEKRLLTYKYGGLDAPVAVPCIANSGDSDIKINTEMTSCVPSWETIKNNESFCIDHHRQYKDAPAFNYIDMNQVVHRFHQRVAVRFQGAGDDLVLIDTGLLGPQAIPVTATEMNSLDAERVLDYFLNASSDGFNGNISSVPPALPTEGQVFVFDLGPDKSLWENNKRKFRMPPAAIDDIPHASFSNENNAPSNVVIEGDSQSTYFANDTGFDNISWNEYLTKINILFPDILAASYVCEATYYKEIEYLRPGCIVVLQTARSNQVAFLRRMFDDSNGGKPIVEVISTYMAPDRSELNYHAGIAVRSHGVIEVTVKHCGVQFIESEEDILLAGLVFHACYQPESDLSKVSS